MAQPLVNSPCHSPCQFPQLISCQLPFSRVPLTYLESLFFAWCDPRPPWSQVACKLTSPFPPHSNFPTPHGFPKSIVRPSKTTSRYRLHIVRNSKRYLFDSVVKIVGGKTISELFNEAMFKFSAKSRKKIFFVAVYIDTYIVYPGFSDT